MSSGNNYLFAIAIDKYQYAPTLSNCVRDAKGFIEILTSKYDFEPKNDDKQLIFTLFNEEATRGNILTKLKDLRKVITPSDNLILYYSGHGEIDGDTGFWVPVGAHPDRDYEFVSTLDITGRLDAIHSFHTFLLVDACFSGSLFTTYKSLKKGIESNPSRWGLAASHSREVALDGRSGENSPFADRLLKILRDSSSDFGVQKLCADLIEEVQRVTNGKQTPVFQPLNVKGHELGQYVFHLKKDETADWKMAVDKNTVEAYGKYLATYPKGKYRNEAEKRIDGWNAGALWSKIETAPDANLWEISKKTRLIDEYIEKYRGEKQYMKVLQEGKKLTWKKKFLNGRGDKYALLGFIAENPPFFKEEAEKILREWKQKEEIADIASAAEKGKTRQAAQKREEALRQKMEQERLQKEATLRKQKQKELRRKKEIEAKRKEKEKKPSFFKKYAKQVATALIAIFILLLGSQLIPDNIGNKFFLTENNGQIEEKETPATKAEIIFNQLLTEATDFFEKKDFANAKKKYQEAITAAEDFDFDIQKAKDGIKNCDAELKKIAEKQSVKEKENNYNKWEKKGDDAYNNGDYKKAKAAYEMAKTYSNTTAVINKITSCIEKLSLPSAIIALENNMVGIPAGSFTMGCTSEQSNCSNDEKPTQKVTVSSFKLNKYEVTQEEWLAVMGKNPSKFEGCNKCPVELVSWDGVQEFIKKLNKMTGERYRLPTEAEWEYAARGRAKLQICRK